MQRLLVPSVLLSIAVCLTPSTHIITDINLYRCYIDKRLHANKIDKIKEMNCK